MAQSFDDPIMLDMETLGTSPNSVILSIGAVKFDPDTKTVHSDFYVVLDRGSCVSIGMSVDSRTEEWWSQQSAEAQKVLRQAAGIELYAAPDGTLSPAVDVKTALQMFENYASDHSCVWGNGSDFDNAMLQEAYNKMGMPTPWKFWNNRCYRTKKACWPDVRLNRVGTYHNALDDAKTQAIHLMEILEREEKLKKLLYGSK